MKTHGRGLRVGPQLGRVACGDLMVLSHASVASGWFFQQIAFQLSVFFLSTSFPGPPGTKERLHFEENKQRWVGKKGLAWASFQTRVRSLLLPCPL